MNEDENPPAGPTSPHQAGRNEPVDLTRYGDFDITRPTEFQGEANRRSITQVFWRAGIVLFFGSVMLVAALFTGAPWSAYLMIGLYILVPLIGIIYWVRIYRSTDPARSPGVDQDGDELSDGST